MTRKKAKFICYNQQESTTISNARRQKLIRYDQQATLLGKATQAKGHTRSPANLCRLLRRSHTEVGEDRWLTRLSLTLPKWYLATFTVEQMQPAALLICSMWPLGWPSRVLQGFKVHCFTGAVLSADLCGSEAYSYMYCESLLILAPSPPSLFCIWLPGYVSIF